MSSVKHLIRRAQIFSGERPRLFEALYKLRGKGDWIVGPETQVVIEGFPRSANTFSVWAFNLAQGKEMRMAHHMHLPAQITLGVKRKLPTLVLIRNPEDAITSLLMKQPQSVETALDHYISFYETTQDFSENIVLGHFDEVTTDFGAVITKMNERFGTDFSTFDHTEENVAAVYERIESLHRARNNGMILESRIARPSGEKASHKPKIQALLQDPAHEPKLERAKALYESYIQPHPR